MDTIKIIKGVFNNEDIIKDNNAIAAAFSDGTAIGIDTKNDDKFQKDFLSGSGNKDEKEIYISTIDMLTPIAVVENSSSKRLRVTGVRCKNVSHSDSNKSIPEEAVNTLSNKDIYKDLTLQMPASANWNFNSSGTATTNVTFSAKGKSGSVKSTTKQGKFVVTQPIKVQFYEEAAGQLNTGSTVYKKGNTSFEETTLQQNQDFQSGKKIRACTEVTRATQKYITVDDSGSLSQVIDSTDKWLKISCGTHSCLVVKYGSETFDSTCSGSVQTSYETTSSEILAGALVKIGIYKQNQTTETATIENFNAQNSSKIEYATPTYTKVNEYSYTPDKSLFYTGIYSDSRWYDSEGEEANELTEGTIYSEQPTAGSGNRFDGTEIFYVEGETENANADDDLCTVDSTGNVLLKTSVNLAKNVTYLIGSAPSYSVSFD